VLVSDFHYDLPEELTAQEPLADRAASRMLHLNRATGHWHDRQFRDFPGLLRPDDLVVFNNTRVFPARLYGRRSGLKSQPLSPSNPAARDFLRGRIEVLLTRQVSSSRNSNDPKEWKCLVRPGRKIGVGERLFFGEKNELQAEVVARGAFGERRIRFQPVDDFFDKIEKLGHIPLPPYISRAPRAGDERCYQTVYACAPGAVAAPTAGLHFDEPLLAALAARGVQFAYVTLHVGAGTFQPVREKNLAKHRMHGERYGIPAATVAAVEAAKRRGGKVIAVGTTTVRCLETSAAVHGAPVAGAAESDLFITPGFEFQVVDRLVTNFHLPRSTLLVLVSAFAGIEPIRRAYRHAIEQRYRFYSYGDAMLVDKIPG